MITRLTREQAAIIGAYTGICCGPFSDLHAKIEEVIGRPVWTHEMANKETMKEVRAAAKTQFLELCALEEE